MKRADAIDGWARLGLAGGVVAPLLFVGATVIVTLVDKPFVDDSEWSAVHRSEVGWPSVVMLGPNGGVVIAALVTCGVLVIGFASALWLVVPDAPRVRAAAVLLGSSGSPCASSPSGRTRSGSTAHRPGTTGSTTPPIH